MIHTMNTINQLNDKLFYAVATQHLGVGEAKLILHEAVINDDGSVVYGAGGTVIVEPSAIVINREFKTDDTKQVDDKEWIAQLEAMLKSRTQEVKELKAKTANLPKKTTQVIKPIPKTFTVSKSDYEWLQMNRPTHLPKSNK